MASAIIIILIIIIIMENRTQSTKYKHTHKLQKTFLKPLKTKKNSIMTYSNAS